MESLQNVDYLSAWGIGASICTQMSISAAIELNVFNIISDSGPDSHLSASEIVAKIPTTNPNAATALERILRVLCASSLLTTSLKSIGGRESVAYGLTPETRTLVTNHGGVSFAPMMLLTSSREFVQSLYSLKDAVMESDCVPFQKQFGMSLFEYMRRDSEFSRVFQDGMTSGAEIFFARIFEVYGGFGDLKELMDVGGGNGTSLQKIISLYPHVVGINFDLPHVIAEAANYPGIEHVAGDMFESLPNAQTILLKWVLHDWNDEECKKILTNCWKALPENGKVIVLEYAMPEAMINNKESLNVIAGDLYMMLLTVGKERTVAEYEVLAKSAGFCHSKIFPISHGIHVLEFFKNSY